MGISASPVALFAYVSDLPRQLQTYVDLGFDVADIQIPADAGSDDAVLVLPHAMVPFHELITRLHLADSAKPGIFDRNFEDPDRYRPVDEGGCA